MVCAYTDSPVRACVVAYGVRVGAHPDVHACESVSLYVTSYMHAGTNVCVCGACWGHINFVLPYVHVARAYRDTRVLMRV